MMICGVRGLILKSPTMDILTKSPSQFQSLNLSSKFSTSTILEIEWTNKNSITQSVQDVSKMCKCITLIAQLSRNKRTFNIVYYIGRIESEFIPSDLIRYILNVKYVPVWTIRVSPLVPKTHAVTRPNIPTMSTTSFC